MGPDPPDALRGLAALLRPAVLAATVVLACGDPAPVVPVADRILRGGPVLTLDGENRVASAIALADGMILAVGDETEIERHRGETTTVTELDGRAVLPGFIDAHSHLALAAEVASFWVDGTSPPVGTATTIEDLVAALRARASETPAGEWLLLWGYDDTLLQERRHPTRHDLDRASADHPILALHVSAHLAVANSHALELAGIDAATPQPEGGLIRHDARGRPDGVLEELPAFGRVLAVLPARPETVRQEALLAAAERYLAAGITTAQNGLTDLGQLEDLEALAAADRLPLRVVALPDYAAAERMLDGERTFAETDRFAVGAVKLIADGSIQGYTGHLREPYHTPYRGDATYRGYPVLEAGELARRVARLWQGNLQVAVHGNGDAAIDAILTAFSSARQRFGAGRGRPIVIHAQMTREDQLEKMSELGVVPSFFVLHTWYWGDRHRELFLGPQRAARISPTRSAIRHGVRFTLHTDTPIVPMEPLRLVWSAVHRRTLAGATLGPEQRLTVTEALRAVTIDAAYQHFQDRERGSLEPGKMADLVVLSANPLDHALDLHELEVVETIVAGATAYDDLDQRTTSESAP